MFVYLRGRKSCRLISLDNLLLSFLSKTTISSLHFKGCFSPIITPSHPLLRCLLGGYISLCFILFNFNLTLVRFQLLLTIPTASYHILPFGRKGFRPKVGGNGRIVWPPFCSHFQRISFTYVVLRCGNSSIFSPCHDAAKCSAFGGCYASPPLQPNVRYTPVTTSTSCFWHIFLLVNGFASRSCEHHH